MKPLASIEFSLVSINAVLSFDTAVKGEYYSFLRDFAPKFGKPNAEPRLLGPIDIIPNDLPWVTMDMGSVLGKWQVFKTRFSIEHAAGTGSMGNLPQLCNTISDVFRAYVDSYPSRITRLGAVVRRVAVHDSPGMFLARHFCKEQWEKQPLNRPESFELHAHKTYMLKSGLKVNSWVRNKSALQVVDKQAVVVVEQDINTVEGTDRALTADDIGSYFQLTPAEFDRILGLYYPSEA